MAKYFLISYETLPVEAKKNIGLIKYVNFGILFFLFMVTIKKGEQVLMTENNKSLALISMHKVEDQVKMIAKEVATEIKEEIKEEIPEHINRLAETFKSEIQQEGKGITSKEKAFAQERQDQYLPNNTITIHMKYPIQNEELSVLLLSIFEELQIMGEDSAYIDIERTKLGAVSAIHIKNVKNFDEQKLQILMAKISKDTKVTLHKA